MNERRLKRSNRGGIAYVANNLFPLVYLNDYWRLVYGTFLQISTQILFRVNRKKPRWSTNSIHRDPGRGLHTRPPPCQDK